ncbi:rhodanese-like domain-containing protein [uncultured Bilophila sp.]|uniref:rhodanese-like domain-containing protein n=1 Tax=uncultured Bilophila sp. TaxID=529385 RepID=UPI00280AD595|nr:rhodanese-like domain-containing protein [uncultured Bilophila sp.]
MLETLSPQEAMTLFRNGGAFFVDVRTEKEFLKRAIPGCSLVPLDMLEREGRLGERFCGKPIVFFCRSGNRTRNKADLLEKSASGKAYQLGGGILAWEQAGFPVWSIRELLPCFAQKPPFASGFLA